MATIVSDRTPYGNDGTNHGATIGSDGASFDGENDYIEITDNDYLDIGEYITIASWVKLDNIREDVYETFVGKLSASGFSYDGPYSLWAWRGGLSSNGISFRITSVNAGVQTVNTDEIPEQNKWYFIVGTYDGSIMKIYQDGVLMNSHSTSGSILETNMPLKFGDWDNGEDMFQGNMSNVKIYNRALSADEVKLLYDRSRYN